MKPSHCHWAKAGRKHLAHQSLVFYVYGHLVIEVANVFYGVDPPGVNGEGGLREAFGQLGLLNPLVKGDLDIWEKILLVMSLSLFP